VERERTRDAGRLDRLVWLSLALVASLVILAASWLTPSATGVGTHEQLGLPPCGMLAWLGIPCPACGLTTAFAHLAHGDLLASLRAHPLGAPLFLVTCLSVPGSLWALSSGISVMGAIERVQADRAALYFVLGALAVWGIRLSNWR
jgi:hypothetical protein